MQEDNSTIKLIVISVLGGILLLILAVFAFEGKDQKVSLPIKFEQFTDFQCPACAAYHTPINTLLSEYSSDNVAYTFVNYPLLQLHPGSKLSHQAGVAAANQGQFEAYANLLFSNQDAQSETDLIKYATDLGLDLELFKSDMYSDATISKVESDMKYGESLNINYTPAFYINGERVTIKEGDDPMQVLRDKLNELIAKAQ